MSIILVFYILCFIFCTFLLISVLHLYTATAAAPFIHTAGHSGLMSYCIAFDLFFSILQCLTLLLGGRKGIRPVKT